jgi:hypothetical protein
MRSVRAAVVALLACSGLAHADDKELDKASVIYARGSALYQATAKGAGEKKLVDFTGKLVRRLETDPKGGVLLADIDGKWSWTKLDGSGKPLAPLACGDGPAQLDLDGTCVLCRSPQTPTKSVVLNLATGKALTVDASATAARIVGTGSARRLVWAQTAIWSAPITDLARKTKVGPEAPLRSLAISHDGSRAVGVYSDYEFDGKLKKPMDVLMSFALDGVAARRKGIRNAIPVDWSFDNQYALVQDGSAACLMRAGGGQYKCWKGYTGVSVAPDASYALVLGNRDPKAAPKAAPKPKTPPKPGTGTDDEPAAADDVVVAPPTGPLALYRAKLDGPYDSAPILVVKVVDGAAVWIPGK